MKVLQDLKRRWNLYHYPCVEIKYRTVCRSERLIYFKNLLILNTSDNVEFVISICTNATIWLLFSWNTICILLISALSCKSSALIFRFATPREPNTTELFTDNIKINLSLYWNLIPMGCLKVALKLSNLY